MKQLEELKCALDKFNTVSLGVFPTPIHKLNEFEDNINQNEIWIKRDDLTGLGLGGNKTRNLEFLLGDAISKGADTIITSGPLQSNVCTLTAAASRKLGLDCITVHDSEVPKILEGNQILNHLLGIKSYYIGEKSYEETHQFVDELSDKIKAEGKNPYTIHRGGSTPMGSLGYVKAAVEFFEQTKDLNIKHVFMPSGYNGTVTGLIVGAGLLGIPFHVHPISVEYPKAEANKIIRDFAAGIEDLLGLKISYPLEEIMTINDDYMGGGWGELTEESKSMVYEFPQSQGIFIENIYTSKVVVGMYDMLKKGMIPKGEGVCYWHTGGLSSLFAQIK